MATTNPVSSNDQLVNSLNQTRKPENADNQQDNFLKLLVTQMQNQDPLNPMDNAQVTTQLAQISTVSGIEKLNKALEGMATSFMASQSVQAGSLIGRGVLGPGNNMVLQQGAAVGGLELAEPADFVTVTVLGAAGETVKTLTLGAKDEGLTTFAWDGSTNAGGIAKDGKYTFEVSAVRAGEKVEAKSLGFGEVKSVTLGTDQLQLNTVGLGVIGLGQIKQIF